MRFESGCARRRRVRRSRRVNRRPRQRADGAPLRSVRPTRCRWRRTATVRARGQRRRPAQPPQSRQRGGGLPLFWCQVRDPRTSPEYTGAIVKSIGPEAAAQARRAPRRGKLANRRNSVCGRDDVSGLAGGADHRRRDPRRGAPGRRPGEPVAGQSAGDFHHDRECPRVGAGRSPRLSVLLRHRSHGRVGVHVSRQGSPRTPPPARSSASR